MIYRIKGVSTLNGDPCELSVEADTEAEAVKLAKRDGVTPTSVESQANDFNVGGWGLGVCIAFAVLVTIANFSAPKPDRPVSVESTKSTKPAKSNKLTKSKVYTVDNDMAWVMAQTFIRRELKSPSTASFGSIFNGDLQTTDDVTTYYGRGEYRVRGWVDAENSFGAKIRSRFSCVLKDDGSSWSLVSINID